MDVRFPSVNPFRCSIAGSSGPSRQRTSTQAAPSAWPCSGCHVASDKPPAALTWLPASSFTTCTSTVVAAAACAAACAASSASCAAAAAFFPPKKPRFFLIVAVGMLGTAGAAWQGWEQLLRELLE